MPWKISLPLQNSVFVFWRVALNPVRSLRCLLLTQTLTLHNANSASLNRKWCFLKLHNSIGFPLVLTFNGKRFDMGCTEVEQMCSCQSSPGDFDLCDPCMEETWKAYVSCSLLDTSVAVVERYVYRYYWILRASTKSFVGFKMLHFKAYNKFTVCWAQSGG